jgi:hypothetical protein
MQTTLKLVPFLLNDGGYQFFLEGSIGRKKTHFLVDTGASRTVFDEHCLQKRFPEFSFHPGEVVTVGFQDQLAKSREVAISGLKLGKLSVSVFNAIAVDLSYVNKTYAKFGLKKIDGIIGSELLVRLQSKIDFKRFTISLTSEK